MIRLTRLHGEVFYLNEDMVERIDAHRDTTISTVGGNVYTVHETAEEVAHLVRLEKAAILHAGGDCAVARPNLTVVGTGDGDDE